jgi:hypothetical protein
MAKNDQGYTRARRVSYRGGGGRRGMTEATYIARVSKAEHRQMYLRTQTEGYLDILGIAPTSDMAVEIRRGVVEAYENGPNMTKEELFTAAQTGRAGMQAFDRAEGAIRRHQEADVLLAALESATSPRERSGLDRGDYLDDLPALTLEGSGWGADQPGAKRFQKHVNICVDNSGSTHMPSTGYCARAMSEVAQNLMEILYEAAGRWPGVTWDAFSFNRIARQHTGSIGRANRAEEARQALEHIWVRDPLNEDARETNLAPLIEDLYNNEVTRDLIGQPRIDIVITDGEFESEDDGIQAAEWQRQRGAGVNSYIINLCPDVPSDVPLPHQFRVIPLHCMTGTELRKEVDGTALRQTLMRIVVNEMGQD